jgi:riboflavin transporter FmnP
MREEVRKIFSRLRDICLFRRKFIFRRILPMDSGVSKINVKALVIIAMLTALAYVSTLLIRIPFPALPFLTYDPKDVFIIIGGFLYGPFVIFPMSAALSLLEMPISGTGPIGLVMNIVATCAFAFPAAVIYRYNRTVKGAVIGLFAGIILMLPVMALWNYMLTPLFTQAPRQAVSGLLLPAILPFNLFKGIYNAAITMILYKQLSKLLRRFKLAGTRPDSGVNKRLKSGVAVTAIFFLFVSAVLFTLVFMDII